MSHKIQRSYSRTVGKSGGTRAGKIFGAMVARWDSQKRKLASQGFKIEYDSQASVKVMVGLYRVTFPDGHVEIMTMEQALQLGN